MYRTVISICVFAALAGCSDFPQIPIGATARSADYPELVPMEDILESAGEKEITAQSAEDLSNRLARLRAQAAALLGPVVDAETKSRLEAGVDQSEI